MMFDKSHIQLTQPQERLVNYLINHNFLNLNNEEVQEMISGMTAQAITESLEEARKRMNSLKSSGLGRELV